MYQTDGPYATFSFVPSFDVSVFVTLNDIFLDRFAVTDFEMGVVLVIRVQRIRLMS